MPQLNKIYSFRLSLLLFLYWCWKLEMRQGRYMPYPFALVKWFLLRKAVKYKLNA